MTVHVAPPSSLTEVTVAPDWEQQFLFMVKHVEIAARLLAKSSAWVPSPTGIWPPNLNSQTLPTN